MRLWFIAIFLGIAFQSEGQGIFLNQGDSYVFEFRSLLYSRPSFPTEESGQYQLLFKPYSVTVGGSVFLEAYANTLSDVPRTITFHYPEDPAHGDQNGIFRAGDFFFGEPFWPDLQGIVRVTMLMGNAELNGLAVKQVLDGSAYEGVFPVPEPSTYSLMLFGAIVSIFACFRRIK